MHMHMHMRWSGEGCWVPLDDTDLQPDFENATSQPAPGHVLLYPGGSSETELLLAYGGVCFASKVGRLAGNHILTILEGNESLVAPSRLTLWSGTQDILFEAAPPRCLAINDAAFRRAATLRAAGNLLHAAVSHAGLGSPNRAVQG